MSNLKEHIQGMEENILGALYDLEGGAEDVGTTMNDIKGYVAALIAKIREGEEKIKDEAKKYPMKMHLGQIMEDWNDGYDIAKQDSITNLKEAEELLK